MTSKWIGAILIIAGSSFCGFSAAAAGKRETRMLQELLRAVCYMENELQYKLTPLPELCRQTGKLSSGVIHEVFLNLSRELEWQLEPDVGSCMAEAIGKSHGLSCRPRKILLRLGDSLGRFDLPGQLKELEYVRVVCENELKNCLSGQELRMRNYRTLGMCTGAALVILFL